jgi:hypothetical protein
MRKMKRWFSCLGKENREEPKGTNKEKERSERNRDTKKT